MFSFTLKKSLLVSSLQFFPAVIKNNHVVKSMSNILVRGNFIHGELRFIGGDEQLNLNVKYGEMVSDLDNVCFSVNGSTFVSMISSFGKENITFELRDDNSLKISDGKSKYVIDTAEGESHPLYVSEHSVTMLLFKVSSKLLTKAFVPNEFCKEHSRNPNLVGLSMTGKDDKLVCCGSDSVSFMEMTVDASIESPFEILIHKNSISLLQRINAKQNSDYDVVFSHDGNSIECSFVNVWVNMSTLSGSYVNYKDKIDLGCWSSAFVADKKDIKSAISRSMICLDKMDVPRMKIDVNKDRLSLLGGNGNNVFTEDLEIESFVGDDIVKYISATNWSGILDAFDVDKVNIKLSNIKGKPMIMEVLSSDKKTDYQYWAIISLLISAAD